MLCLERRRKREGDDDFFERKNTHNVFVHTNSLLNEFVYDDDGVFLRVYAFFVGCLLRVVFRFCSILFALLSEISEGKNTIFFDACLCSPFKQLQKYTQREIRRIGGDGIELHIQPYK